VVTRDAEVAVDAGAVAAGSLLIAGAAHHLAWMTVAIPLLVSVRTALWWKATRHRETPFPLGAEVTFLALCTALGAFNDWSSVVRHGIYEYTVPCYFPQLTTIPIWMLLFWGLVLRLFITLGNWARLGAPARLRDRVGLGPWHTGRAWLRVALLLLLALGTRQTIYRFYGDPLWSWLPFAAALGLYPLLFGLTRHEARLAGLTLAVGPLVEVLYIQVAGLHRYALGWLGGVPLWIALWWVLAVLLWRDLGSRIQLVLFTAWEPRTTD
jgi:hypothetical protein